MYFIFLPLKENKKLAKNIYDNILEHKVKINIKH